MIACELLGDVVIMLVKYNIMMLYNDVDKQKIQHRWSVVLCLCYRLCAS